MAWNTSSARTITTTVRVNGVERPHASVTWGQDIVSDLPAPVTAGGQMAHRTGTIQWSTPGVSTVVPSPWHTGLVWVPTVGDAVTVDVSDGQGTTVRVFTGVIDTLEGGVGGPRSSKIIADLKGGTRTMRLLAQPRAGGLPAENRYGTFGTTPVWAVTETVRRMGYHPVPPSAPGSKRILDAPLQGSTYNSSLGADQNATLVRSDALQSSTGHPNWKSSSEGFGVSSAFLEWVPGAGGGTGAGAVGLSLVVYSTHTGLATMTVTHGSDTVVLRVEAAGKITASITVGGTTTTPAITPTIPSEGGPHRVSVVLRGGTMNILVAGTEQTLSVPTPGGAVTRMRLEAHPGACVAGFQVWHPATTTDHIAPGWAPSARFRHGAGTIHTLLSPSLRDVKAKDVLADYAQSLLTPVWIDGDGVLQVVTGKALHEQSSSMTVDALREASELSYRMDLLDHHPGVELIYAQASHANATATKAKTPVWQGNGAQVDPDAPDEVFVEVPDDEEWIGLVPPTQAQELYHTNWAQFITGEGSWWGLSTEGEQSDLLFLTDAGSQKQEQLTPWAWKITTTYPEAAGAVQKSRNDGGPARYRDLDLPIIRSLSKATYIDQPVLIESGTGAPGAGILTHEAGKWITTEDEATNLADWLHSMVSTPTPVLDGMTVRFNPTLDIGVKITVLAKKVFGADFEALILSVDHDPKSGTTTLTVRVTRVLAYASTLESVDYAHIGQSLAYWDQARASRSLTAVDAAPYLT